MIASLEKSDILLALTRLGLAAGIRHQEMLDSIMARKAELLAGILNEVLRDKESAVLLRKMQAYPTNDEDL